MAFDEWVMTGWYLKEKMFVPRAGKDTPCPNCGDDGVPCFHCLSLLDVADFR